MTILTYILYKGKLVLFVSWQAEKWRILQVVIINDVNRADIHVSKKGDGNIGYIGCLWQTHNVWIKSSQAMIGEKIKVSVAAYWSTILG